MNRRDLKNFEKMNEFWEKQFEEDNEFFYSENELDDFKNK